jgi:hypothetical protein
MKNHIVKSVLLFTALAATGCGLFDKNPDAYRKASLEAGTIGVKNVNQLAYSMAAVTGVPLTYQVTTPSTRTTGVPTTIAISTHVNTIAPMLSVDGNIENVNPTMLLSITGLAGLFCRGLVQKEALIALTASGRKFTIGVDFSKGPSSVSSAVRDATHKAFAQNFWNRPATDEELTILTDAFNEAASALTGGQGTQDALQASCTAALASLEFLKS